MIDRCLPSVGWATWIADQVRNDTSGRHVDSQAVIPDSDPGSMPRKLWIADQVRNDDTGLIVPMQFRRPKLAARDAAQHTLS